RAGVREVLALQVHAIPGLLGQSLGKRQRRGAPHVVAKQRIELAAERRIVAERGPRVGELFQRRHQDLRHVASTELPEPARCLERGAHVSAFTSCADSPVTAASSPRSCRSFAAGFFARMSASPTRMACAPAPTARSTWARVEIPLSNTTVRPAGTIAA